MQPFTPVKQPPGPLQLLPGPECVTPIDFTRRRPIVIHPPENPGAIPMNPFKTFTLKWWQAALFKVSLLSPGLMIGAAWADVFNAWRPALLVLFALSTSYMVWIWWKQ